ncbi:hypothetical protein [Alteromonas sp. ASW11-130]|uniref:hypothetical protein n=1 Tax=Alteromonas sp. ASW11-130 TaxID=3015775 RepID=UPI002242347E|nr:hypothetical protein [Alteromonas sp. ASW11-130]MCW8091042.1 hypothetical protein [Alteromonas sp. ASW11-130]
MRRIKNSTPKHTLRSVTIIIGFAFVLMTLIIFLNRPEPDFKEAMLEKLAEKFERSVISSYYQWKAENQPEMIMFVHYDNNGKETDRRPVRIARNGWPKVNPTSEGCEDLWRMLLNVPMIIDGFKVFGEFFPGKLDDDELISARCRFRLSSGPYFDYHIDKGTVNLEAQ